MTEFTFTTKCFGDITIVEKDSHGNVNIIYDNHEINIFLCNYNLYGEKVKLCLEIMDKYVEINEIGKKAILKNFNENEIIKYYFECYFDIFDEEQLLEIFETNQFEELDIENVVEKLEYPNLLFDIKDNEITISVDYMVSKEYSDEILCVRMDEKLNITGFSHES
ncbi:MAG: DUF2004 domain-containing protein [Deltaproteobacteria bacterium]|nr:DUF2004 domain-containing protein [Deltaproteobacteria bacterium]